MPTIKCVYMGKYDHEYGRAWWDGEAIAYEGNSSRDILAMEGMVLAAHDKFPVEKGQPLLEQRLPEMFTGIVWASPKDEELA